MVAYLLDTGMQTMITGRGNLEVKAVNAIFLDFLRRNEVCFIWNRGQASPRESMAAYLLDTGMQTMITGRGNLGVKAVSAIFLDFLRRGMRPGYYAEGEGEIDAGYGPFSLARILFIITSASPGGCRCLKQPPAHAFGLHLTCGYKSKSDLWDAARMDGIPLKTDFSRK
ncbi:MAG: hypothetical protein C4536_06875 [Actinobacteria bacterium]|jgi:uncharacterized protein (DUF2164 family)|nr:MAG: hypothetical protein C4536_06875 [Actinomycetota bacterium]